MPSHGRNPEEKTPFGRPVPVREDPLITWVSLGYSAVAAATAVRSPSIVVLSLDDLSLLMANSRRNRGKRHKQRKTNA